MTMDKPDNTNSHSRSPDAPAAGTSETAATPEPAPAAESAAPGEEAAAPAPPRRGMPPLLFGVLGGLVGGVLIVLLAVVVAGSNVGALRQALLAPQDQRLAALDQRLGEAENRLAAVEHRAPAAGDAGQAAGTQAGDLQGLSQRLSALEAQLRGAGADPRTAGLADQTNRLSTEVGHLKDDMEALRRAMPPEGTILRLADRAQAAEQQLRDLATRRQSAEALLLVVGQLRDAVDRGGPYQAELQAARRIAPPEDAAQLDALSGGAAKGITRREVLLDRFPGIANATVRAAVAPPDGNFWQRSLAKLTQLVSLRRIDGQGDSTAAVVARAERQVKDGDLAKAVDELSALQGAPAAQAQAWVAAAKARIAADRALSELTAATAAQTAKTGG